MRCGDEWLLVDMCLRGSQVNRQTLEGMALAGTGPSDTLNS